METGLKYVVLGFLDCLLGQTTKWLMHIILKRKKDVENLPEMLNFHEKINVFLHSKIILRLDFTS